MQLKLGFDYDDWVEEKAYEIYQRAKDEIIGWEGKPFIPVEKIARDIFFLDLLPLTKELMIEGVTAAIEAEEGGGTIYYRENDSIESKRFSIAHEIGHYVCHFLPYQQQEKRKTFYQNKCFVSEVTLEYRFKQQMEELSKFDNEERAERLKRAHQESEANKFAAELLMPAHLIRDYFERLKGDINALAEVFKVSKTAMKIRINDLGLKLTSINIPPETILADLNPVQQKVVENIEGPVLILAGAGTGKTRVITHRIAYKIGVKKINPRNILAVTFTNKAAREMRERIHGLLSGAEYGRSLWIKTFHAFSLAILRREAKHLQYEPNFTIADENTQKGLIRGVCNFLNIDKDCKIDFVSEIKNLKNQFILPDKVDELAEIGDKVKYVYKEYQRRLKVLNQMDFDDILINIILLFAEKPEILKKYQNRFKYILVDEYQDTNYVQFLLVWMLAREHRNICVVGDDDQSIYGWRGASIKNFSRFKKEFEDAEIIPLEQNYRSTRTILNAANAFVAGNNNRLRQKKLWTENNRGERISIASFENDEMEARGIAEEISQLISEGKEKSEISVMYRTHAQSRTLEKELIRLGVPYQVVKGVPFKDRCEIKDILAFMHFLNNQYDDESLIRILDIKTIAPGIGKETINKLKLKANEVNKSLWEVLLTEVEGLKLRSNIQKSLNSFKIKIDELIDGCRGSLPSRIIEKTLSNVNFIDYLRETYGKDEDGIDWEDRKENIEELIRIAQEYEEQEGHNVSLQGFLDHLALYESEDVYDENGKVNQINLMTIHSAKGLEFKYVFLIGLQQGLFPLSRNQDLEEERRLFYVGLTRAKEKLYLSFGTSKWDFKAKEVQPLKMSDFLNEIPESLLIKWQPLVFA